MRKRPRKGLKKSSYLKVGLLMLPFVLGLMYVGGALYIINDITSEFFVKHYDSGSFIPANFTAMAEWADQMELRFEQYHMPSNISLRCTFNGYNYTNVSSYHGTDNVALSTGMALATECFRYRAAVNEGNASLKASATEYITRLLTGFSYLLAVPNGGIGPDYPGSISRFYWAPDHVTITGYQGVTNWMLNENEERHFNGTGAYQNYRWRGTTSKDEMAGYLFGLGAVIQHCQNESWIFERARLLIAQMIEGYIKTNWIFINGDGHPVGSDMKSTLFVSGGEWILTLLRIGKTAYPDGRYDALYHFFATKDTYMNCIARSDALNLIMDYYAWNFEHKVMFNLITLEDNPRLKNFFINSYVTGIYDKIKYTRSPYFNMMYLVFTGCNDSDIKADVFDQLMRFENNQFCRNVNSTPRPANHTINPDIIKWRDFVQNNPLGALYEPLTLEVGVLSEDGRNYYLEPATVDMLYTNVGNFYESNPHEERSGAIHRDNNGLTEGPGNCFTVVYWMGRAYGIIPPP